MHAFGVIPGVKSRVWGVDGQRSRGVEAALRTWPGLQGPAGHSLTPDPLRVTQDTHQSPQSWFWVLTPTTRPSPWLPTESRGSVAGGCCWEPLASTAWARRVSSSHCSPAAVHAGSPACSQWPHSHVQRWTRWPSSGLWAELREVVICLGVQSGQARFKPRTPHAGCGTPFTNLQLCPRLPQGL